MKLVSMKQDAKEATEYGAIGSSDPDEMPAYPYGLTISLDDEGLAKLGMSLPVVGGKYMLMAMVECCNASAERVQDGDAEISARFQITDMSIEGGKDAATTLWPDKD